MTPAFRMTAKPCSMPSGASSPSHVCEGPGLPLEAKHVVIGLTCHVWLARVWCIWPGYLMLHAACHHTTMVGMNVR